MVEFKESGKGKKTYIIGLRGGEYKMEKMKVEFASDLTIFKESDWIWKTFRWRSMQVEEGITKFEVYLSISWIITSILKHTLDRIIFE